MAEETQHDWYKILGCSIDSTKEQIAKASRLLSLKYHPDKTDAPDAPAKFLLVQKAKEVLMDDSKRKEIDDVIRTKLKRKEHESARNSTMDNKRKKMKEDFEARLSKEAGGDASTTDSNQREQRSHGHGRNHTKSTIDKDELDKLRKANKAHMTNVADTVAEDEERKAREFMMHRSSMINSVDNDGNNSSSNEGSTQIKIKWRKSGVSESDDSLFQLFKVFGSIEDITIRDQTGSSAIITFSDGISADKAVRAYDLSSQYKVSKLAIKDNVNTKASVFSHQYSQSSSSSTNTTTSRAGSAGSDFNGQGQGQGVGEESELLREMRRAVEREALLRAIEKEENVGDMQAGSSASSNSSASSANSANSSSASSASSDVSTMSWNGHATLIPTATTAATTTVAASIVSDVTSAGALKHKENDVLQKLKEASLKRKQQQQQQQQQQQ